MVVGPEPAVKSGGAFSAVAVDRAVGPAGEHGADEPLGLPVGLGAAWPGAQVADAKGAAGEGVNGGPVGRAVVGHDALDGDAVTGVERDGAAEERDRGAGLLIAQDLGVGQAGGVVDRDVHVLPAGQLAAKADRMVPTRSTTPPAWPTPRSWAMR